MNRHLAILSLCAATAACAENLPPVVGTAGVPPQAAKPPTPVPSISTVNQMMNRMDQMQREIQQLTGKIEDQVFLIEELKKQQKTMYADYDERLQTLENKVTANPADASAATPDANAATPAAEAAPSEPASPAADTAEAAGAAAVGAEAAATAEPVAADSTATSSEPAAPAAQTKSASTESSPVQASEEEKQEYKKAYNQLSTGETDAAIAAFDAYLVKYPSGGYASNVQYWLGEAYRVKQDVEAARAAFNKVIDNYATSPKVPDALLKLGYIEIEQNNPAKAREYLTRIGTDFPNSNAAYLASKKLATLTDVKP